MGGTKRALVERAGWRWGKRVTRRIAKVKMLLMLPSSATAVPSESLSFLKESK